MVYKSVRRTRKIDFRVLPGYFRVNFRVPIGSASHSSGFSGLTLLLKGKVVYGIPPAPSPGNFPKSTRKRRKSRKNGSVSGFLPGSFLACALNKFRSGP